MANNFKKLWEEFIFQQNLTENQASQFKTYLSMFLEESEKINLTAITSVQGVISYHFVDSLEIKNFLDLNSIKSICDVGTGGGFPGIPIKILYPHLKLFLIEVNHKKVRFLQKVIQALNLENVEIIDLDWRTFLRKTTHKIDLFCARASLRPDELIRAFSPICHYKDSNIVYWAARGFEPDEKVLPFVEKQDEYKVENKRRKFVFLSNPT